MGTNDLIVIRQVKEDLNAGRDFYNSNEKGVGDYFFDTLVSDIVTVHGHVPPIFTTYLTCNFIHLKAD
jgi:hypothetical protein